MSNYTIKNENLTVTISDKGAEILSIINKNGEEIIHQGCKVYPSRCPICFPIIGSFPDDVYILNGKEYTLGIHGFAKNTVFSVEKIKGNEISFKMSATEETLTSYPFDFTLTVTYKIEDNLLKTEYTVENTGKDTMYYSVGSHTGYKLDGGFAEYRIRFEDANSIIESRLLPKNYSVPKNELLKNGIVELEDKLFENGCFTLGNLASKKVILENRRGMAIAKIDFSDFAYLTVWSAPGQSYVCIEPWSCESAHYTDTQCLDKQKDITVLLPHQTKKQRHVYEIC